MKIHNRPASYLAAVIVMFVVGAATITHAQQPSPSPATGAANAAAADDSFGRYSVVSSIEVGVRGLSLTGSDNKYRSDLNYDNGFRLFDSSFFLRSKEGASGAFDEFLVNTSGWGGDPHGYTRVSVEKSGSYRFDANVRRARYFNALQSLANPLNAPVGQHTSNTRHNFSDFDLTGFPESNKLRLYLGYSRDSREEPGTTTARFGGDEYAITSILIVAASKA